MENHSTGKSRIFILLGILTLCLGVRFFCLLQSSWIRPVLDEKRYLRIARSLVDKGIYPASFCPPGYPFYMASLASLGAAKGIPLSTRWSQIFLSLLTCVVLMGMARKVFNEKTAVVTGLLYALYPNLAAFSTLLWSETLFIALLLSSVALLFRNQSSPDRWAVAASGFLMGLAALTRNMILFFLPAIIFWLGRNSRQTIKQRIGSGVVFVAFVGMTILPWTLRNYNVHHRLVLISHNTGFNFLVGNHSPTATWSINPKWSNYYVNQCNSLTENRADRDWIRFLKGWEFIRQRPGTFVVKFFLHAFHLWTTDSFVLRHLRNGWYGKVSQLRIRGITLLVVGSYCLVICTALGGLLLAPPGRMKGLTLLLISYYTLVHGITFAASRHRLPLLPFLLMFSAFFVMEVIKRRGIPREEGFRKKWAAAMVAALLIWGTTFSSVVNTWKTGGNAFDKHDIHTIRY